ncbi:MAG: NAD-dependent epimerase/dehydratase family protein [Candidatus Izemoplasmatales bacterium]
MIHEPKKVLIAGGTGFLGYHAARLLLSEGVAVDAVALPREIDLGTWYPDAIGIRYGDLFAMTEDEVFALVEGRGYDAFVYALGPDDRFVPPAPAAVFFHDRLVVQAAKVLSAVRRAGVSRAVVLNSYFSHFDRIMDGVLSDHHPYVRARVEQERDLARIGVAGSFDVMFLELPFIFGTMPGRLPLWKESFLDHFAKGRVAFFPAGGTTACIAVEGVAEAVSAAIRNGAHGRGYAVGKENLTYREILQIMLAESGMKKPVVSVSPFIAALGARGIDRRHRRAGRESGLDHAKLMGDILARDFSIDFETLARELGYAELGYRGGPDVRESLRATMARYKEPR